jgi:energy-coupling factor transporter ATP-binding protein EcfA2
MKKVKYFIPNIQVKCVTAYCRVNEIATIKRKTGHDDGVLIEYSDGAEDAARIGHKGYYDLEFTNPKDELLQEAMERYPKGCSFISRGGATIEDFDPEYPYWSDDDFIYICSRNYGNIIVYELDSNKWMDVVSSSPPSKSIVKVGDRIKIKHQRERTMQSYCNVKPHDERFTLHNGWAEHSDMQTTVLDVYYAEHLGKWFYKVAEENWYADDSIILMLGDSVPQTEIEASFPEEGQCKTITPELEAYLRKTRTPEGDQAQKEKAKAICWNHKGYWYVSRSSQKQEYSILYLEKFFTQQPKEQPMEPQEAQQQFDYSPQGGFQLTLPPEIVGAALQQATQTHFRESEKKFEKHREDVAALVEKKKQMIETELYQKFEKTIGCDFVEFKTKVVEDYLTSKQVVIELGQEKKYEFSLEDKHEQLPKMVTFLQLFKQAMIVGPSGSGKSTMAKQAAEVMGLRYGAFSCNLEASKSELVGFANIDGYVESSFLDFYENGGVFLVDEYDSMSPSIAVVLNAAFDRTGMIAVPNRKGKTTAKKHKDFYCILAGNTWGSGSVEYQGREMQDAAFLDRFKMCRIFIDYDPQLEKNIAGKHYKFFTKVRNYITKKVDGENFSTRSIYDATMLLQNGFAEKDILTMMSEHWDDALRRDLFKTVGVEYPVAV